MSEYETCPCKFQDLIILAQQKYSVMHRDSNQIRGKMIWLKPKIDTLLFLLFVLLWWLELQWQCNVYRLDFLKGSFSEADEIFYPPLMSKNVSQKIRVIVATNLGQVTLRGPR